MSPKQKNLIRLFKIAKSAEVIGASLIFTFYSLFLVQSGLTEQQMYFVNAIYMASFFILDLPTGSIADIYGQIPIYLFGLFFAGLGYTLYGFSSSFLFAVLCEITIAIGNASMSEALESQLINEVGNEKAKEIMADNESYTRIISIPTILLSGIISTYFGIKFLWFIAGGVMIVGALALIVLYKKAGIKYEPAVQDSAVTILTQIKNGVIILASSHELKILLAISLLSGFLFQPLNMHWNIYLTKNGLNPFLISVTWIGFTLSMSLGSYLSKKLTDSRAVMQLTALGFGIPVIFAGISNNKPILIVFLLLVHQTFRKTFLILIKYRFNKSIQNSIRSSANSANGALQKAANSLGLVFWGSIIGFLGISSSWVAAGTGMSLLAILLFEVKNHSKAN